MWQGVYSGGVRRQFEWEREWRWFGTLRFSHGDLRLVFSLETKHQLLKDRWGDLPFVDPTWDWARIREMVDAHPPRRPSIGWIPVRVGPEYYFFDGNRWTGHYAIADTVGHVND